MKSPLARMTVALQFTLVSLLFAASSEAAQDGRVISERATIHQEAGAESAVIGEVPRGSLLRMSDNPRGGWYRVVVPGTRSIGWINAYDVRPGSAPVEAASRPLPRADREQFESRSRQGGSSDSQDGSRPGTAVYVAGFGFLQMMGGLDLTGVGGPAAQSLNNFSFGGELGYWFTPDWAFALNLSWFKVLQTTTSYSAKSTLIAPMLIKELTHSGSLSFDAGAGLVYATGATVGATVGTRAFETPSFSALGLLIRGGAKYRFTPKVGLQGDLGYRYLTKSALSLSSTTLVDANLSALVLSAGLYFEF